MTRIVAALRTAGNACLNFAIGLVCLPFGILSALAMLVGAGLLIVFFVVSRPFVLIAKMGAGIRHGRKPEASP